MTCESEMKHVRGTLLDSKHKLCIGITGIWNGGKSVTQLDRHTSPGCSVNMESSQLRFDARGDASCLFSETKQYHPSPSAIGVIFAAYHHALSH